MRIRAWKPISQIQISVVCLLEAEILPAVQPLCMSVCEEEKRCVCVCGEGGAARKKYVERSMQC